MIRAYPQIRAERKKCTHARLLVLSLISPLFYSVGPHGLGLLRQLDLIKTHTYSCMLTGNLMVPKLKLTITTYHFESGSLQGRTAPKADESNL